MVGLRKKGSSWDQIWKQPQEAEQLDEWRCHLKGDPGTMNGDSSAPRESEDEACSAAQFLLPLRAKGWPGRWAQDSSITSGKAEEKAQRDSCPEGLACVKKANSLKLRAATLLQLLPFFFRYKADWVLLSIHVVHCLHKSCYSIPQPSKPRLAEGLLFVRHVKI